MQVGRTGWTVVVKTIGQLDVFVSVGGGMITETGTMGKIIDMMNIGK